MLLDVFDLDERFASRLFSVMAFGCLLHAMQAPLRRGPVPSWSGHGFPSSSLSWFATTGSSGGISSAQRSRRRQRGWKEQPGGDAARSGGIPSSGSSFSLAPVQTRHRLQEATCTGGAARVEL